ncbi:MAG: N-acetylmuramoyl-L-alanine amidase [Lachnospiraceae bacterium]|nr:N-acetylmuramoyl-L-alanine amidase [Lachnospiraceae bacterium]
MQDTLLKRMLIFTCIFFALGMGVTLYFAYTKAIVIAEESDQTGGIRHSDIKQGDNLYFAREDQSKGELLIPLPETVRADDIVIENRYAEHTLHLLVKGEYGGFYETHALSGSYAHIEKGVYWSEPAGINLLLSLDRLLETEYVFSTGMLKLRLVEPTKGDQKTVVIDASCGGEDTGDEAHGIREKDVTLAVAEQVRKQFEKTDIRVILTRTDDTFLAAETRMMLANDLKADFFVGIEVSSNPENARVNGMQAFYNGTYFIPYLGGVELADLLEKGASMATGAKVNGIFAASDDKPVLKYTQIPAAVLDIGYLSNPEEAAKLSDPDYITRVSEGIAHAIRDAYQLKEQGT